MGKYDLYALLVFGLAIFGAWFLIKRYLPEGVTPNAPGANRVAVGNP